jgi:L-ascorbate metabolism protein UlaG (beta-lactamase superfamily)
MNTKTSVRLLRHATLVIELNNKKILVDPMLSPKNGLDPVQNCGNETRFPMVELPIDIPGINNIIEKIDAVVISHLHRDHWDIVAQKLIDKNKIIFCQPNDVEKIRDEGFKNIQSIDSSINWRGITIFRTKGHHGTGEIEKKMGEVSGFVFTHHQKSIYLAGDTIWCHDVEKSLLEFSPEVTILNAGGAKFLTGDAITMTPDDVIKVHQKFPSTKIIAVHMDTVNHCFDKRTDLMKALSNKKISSVVIPKDGETITL